MPEKKLRIAVDAKELANDRPAGKGRYAIEIVKHLAKIDSQNEYYLYSSEPIHHELPENCHNIIVAGPFGLKQWKIAVHAKKSKCNVIFAPTNYLSTILSAIPAVVTVHDLAMFVEPKSRPALKTRIAEKFLLGLTVRRAKKIIAVSNSTKHDLEKVFKVPSRKISMILEGYDKDSFQPNETNPKLPDKDVLKEYDLEPDYLLFVGTLEPRKNITGIIESYALLPEELRKKHRLVIGGKKGWFYEEIFARVKELGLENEVSFLGRVPDEHLPGLYRQAKLFLFPSFYEGFGLPPLESLACGTPVVTSNSSSLPEAVGEAGALINPNSTKEMAQEIEKLLTDNEHYNHLQHNASNQAAKFDWLDAAKSTLQVLEDAS